MKKVALVAFNGEPICFTHVLYNALDMKEKGYDVKVILEGSATKQVAELADPASPFNSLYVRVKDAGLIDAVCRACAAKMGALEAAKEQGLPISGDMAGHPPLSAYIDQGYQIITF